MVGIEFERKVDQGSDCDIKGIEKAIGIKPKSKVYITLEGKKIVIKAGGMRLEEFLLIIPPEKRKKFKIKDLDKWYEKELEERWKKIEK